MKKTILYIIVLLLLPVVYQALALTAHRDVGTAVAASADTLAAAMAVAEAAPASPLAAAPDTLPGAQLDSLAADSLAAHAADSAAVAEVAARRKARRDSMFSRPSRLNRAHADLDHVVDFTSTDSMILVGRDSAYMYGQGNVKYGDFSLDANEIEIDLGTSTVYAVGTPDTANAAEVTGKPVFTEGGTSYEADTMRYNFNSRKGLIYNVVTQQGEGYLTSGTAKKGADNSTYFKDGIYTTCDNVDDPHFCFRITKGKMVPGKNVVSGPVYMVVAGLPLPIALPFGYFPFSESYQSGIIVPTFGDDYNRGYYLRNGGYYLAISDNIDMAITGELYTKGSWGIAAQSTYAKRYKFTGNFSVNYLKTILGDKGLPDYSKQTNFQVLWSHTQDSKANPNLSLSASVNFTTSGYTRNDLNSYYSSAFTENTKSSSINLGYRFPNSKWSLSTSLNISQRTQDSTLSVSFPNINVTMSQVQPFKRKRAVGAEKWYEKIRMSYSGQFQNSLTANQDQFFKKSLIKDWRNAMRHNIPVSATFSAFKYLNFTPSINLSDRMYTQKVRRQWDPNAAVEVCDTSYSLYNVWDFNASVSLDTKIYGFYRPLKIFGDKVKMIRHVMTPTVSFSGAPDFGSSFFGYYGSYQRPDGNGGFTETRYSYFPGALYGVPSSGKTGQVSFSLANNLEMKVKQEGDSVEEKKVSLIENFTLSQSYNFAADSLNWSNLNTSLLLRVTKGFNLNLSAVWDVYTYQLNEAGNPVRVNIPRWKAGKGIGRLSSTGTSFSYTFNNDTFKKKKKERKDSKTGDEEGGEPGANPNANRANRPDDSDDQGAYSSDGYQRWEFPWSLSVNYSIGYAYGSFNKEKMEYDPRITQNLSFSGNLRPTKNWNFSFTTSYNFDTHKIAYMNCNVSRDLHCFTMSASFVPVGPYKSYNFSIAVKSSMLSDLKYDKRSSMQNGVTWY